MSVGLVRYAQSIFLGNIGSLEPRLILIIYSSHLSLAFTHWPGRDEPIAKRVALMTPPEVNLMKLFGAN